MCYCCFLSIKNLPEAVRSLHLCTLFAQLVVMRLSFVVITHLIILGTIHFTDFIWRVGTFVQDCLQGTVKIAHYVETMFAVYVCINARAEDRVRTHLHDFTAIIRYLELEYSLEFSAWIKRAKQNRNIKGAELGRHLICCSIQKPIAG